MGWSLSSIRLGEGSNCVKELLNLNYSWHGRHEILDPLTTRLEYPHFELKQHRNAHFNDFDEFWNYRQISWFYCLHYLWYSISWFFISFRNCLNHITDITNEDNRIKELSQTTQLSIQFLHFWFVFVMEDPLVVGENRGMEEPLLSGTDDCKGGIRTLPFIIGNQFL